MKRGLILWDRDELPMEEFTGRVEALERAMRTENLDAVVIYGDASQSGNLSYLTNFFPYADTAVCVVPLSAPPRLFTTHAYRNMPWFRTTTWVEDIVCSEDIGRESADFLSSLASPPRTIGLVNTGSFPYLISETLQKKGGAALVDFTREYENLRLLKSAREMDFVRKAAGISVECFKDLVPHLGKKVTGFDIAAELELAARKRGAEDLLCFIQADDDPAGLTGPDSRRIQRWCSIEVAVEYKGYWAKLGRTFVLASGPSAILKRIDDFAQASRLAVESLSSGKNLRSFLNRMKTTLGAGGENVDISLLVDYGLEPYWSTHLNENADMEKPLSDPIAVYLQAFLSFFSSPRLLRTDTLILLDKKTVLATPF